MKRILLFSALCAALVAPARAAEPDLNVMLSVMGSGYTVKVLVNGADTGITGGKSQSMRLFNKEHPLLAKAPPEMRSRYFVLLPGLNEVAIEFNREPNATNHLMVRLEAEGYPQPLLELANADTASGRHVVKLRIEPKAPADFKPVIITDAK
jgi:hypothetical protein